MAEAALSPLSRLYRAAPVLLVAGLSLVWASRPSIPVVVRGMGLMPLHGWNPAALAPLPLLDAGREPGTGA